MVVSVKVATIRNGKRLTNRPASCWDDVTALRASMVPCNHGNSHKRERGKSRGVAVAKQKAATRRSGEAS